MHALLGATHPRSLSAWGALPRPIFRHVGRFILEPLMSGFSSWHAMSVVKQGGQVLQFGQRLRSGMFLYNSGDAGIATCGPSIDRDSGVWTVELSLSTSVMLDGFCRADLGLVLDASDLSQRCLSGIWWEAGDGDVYVAKDAGGLPPSGAAGWIGGDAAVEEGVLPTWVEGTVGLILDTDKSRLGFSKAGCLQLFEWKVPSHAWPVRFGVGWSADIAGQFRLLSVKHFERRATGPLAVLLQDLAVSDVKRCIASAKKLSAMDPGILAAIEGDQVCRQAVLAVWSRVKPLPAAALAIPMLQSSRQQLAFDLARFVTDIDSFEAALSQHLPCSPSVRHRIRQLYPRWWKALAWCPWCCG
ncbi:unnamed protein product [Effrenium voratum]|nr:unnamed protein product [Effrenium voratum]